MIKADETQTYYRNLAKIYLDEEIKWLDKTSPLEIYNDLIDQLNKLENINNIISANKAEEKLHNKMVYAYAVTLLEAFLGDTLKSLVNQNDKYFQRALKIKELKDAKYSLKDLAKNDIDAKGLAIKELSNILYHNIPKVIEIYKIILNERISFGISELVKIMKIRHDIVHRNGKTKDSAPIDTNKKEILNMISNIKEFAKELQKLINKKA